jgi:hypothetical protein
MSTSNKKISEVFILFSPILMDIAITPNVTIIVAVKVQELVLILGIYLENGLEKYILSCLLDYLDIRFLENITLMLLLSYHNHLLYI